MFSSLIGPSGVRALPLGVAAERSVHYIWYYFSSFFLSLSATYFSPRRSCPLVMPLGVAVERSVHYIWYYFSFFFFLCHILFSQKGLS